MSKTKAALIRFSLYTQRKITQLNRKIERLEGCLDTLVNLKSVSKEIRE